jgi:hypothetical protein
MVEERDSLRALKDEAAETTRLTGKIQAILSEHPERVRKFSSHPPSIAKAPQVVEEGVRR